MLRVILSSLLLLGGASSALADGGDDAADDHADGHAVSLTADSFKDSMAAKTPHFVMFFAPWCGHCKRLAPTWEDLSSKYNQKDEKDVLVGKVDCTKETALCSGQDVTGYPTLKFFSDGAESGVKYRGARDLDNLLRFINEQLGAPAEEEGKEKEKKEEVLSDPEEVVVENGLYILNEKTFKAHTEKGDHFIKFYAPWCGHCQKLAPAWEGLAKDYEKDTRVKIAKLDCTASRETCQQMEVKGYPTLLYVRDGKMIESYRGARSAKELKDFIESKIEELATAPKASEEDGKVPTEDAGSANAAVLDLHTEIFQETISSGVTFIKFFAPWCGHCKRLAPTWDQLGGKFAAVDGVKIAKVDCTAEENTKNKNLCNEQGVNGFPTLNIYKDGSKAGEYSGKRTLEDLASFVEQHLGLSDGVDDDAPAAKDEL